MAKKKATKRKAPKRTCEKCGKGYHPRKVSCPHCSAANPTFKPGGRKRRKTKTSRKKSRGGGDLTTAVDFVSEMGGLDNAQAALDTLRDIKRKL